MPAKGQYVDLTGRVFGYLTVTGLGKQRGYYRWWDCKCSCGKKKMILASSLHSRRSRSCGCYKKEWMEKYKKDRLTTHGKSDLPEYRVWWDMIRRCRSKETKSYKDYGGRGITVCERWQNFEWFYEDMGNRPSPKHTIERKDNNKGYHKDNCVWATYKQQARNTRRTVFVSVNGKEMPLIEAIEGSQIKYSTALYRHRQGYSLEEILAPVK